MNDHLTLTPSGQKGMLFFIKTNPNTVFIDQAPKAIIFCTDHSRQFFFAQIIRASPNQAPQACTNRIKSHVIALMGLPRSIIGHRCNSSSRRGGYALLLALLTACGALVVHKVWYGLPQNLSQRLWSMPQCKQISSNSSEVAANSRCVGIVPVNRFFAFPKQPSKPTHPRGY